jgi:hypothetical protein
MPVCILLQAVVGAISILCATSDCCLFLRTSIRPEESNGTCLRSWTLVCTYTHTHTHTRSQHPLTYTTAVPQVPRTPPRPTHIGNLFQRSATARASGASESSGAQAPALAKGSGEANGAGEENQAEVEGRDEDEPLYCKEVGCRHNRLFDGAFMIGECLLVGPVSCRPVALLPVMVFGICMYIPVCM